MSSQLHGEALLRDTERYLHQHIPLTRAMGLAVESFAGGTLVLAAPLEPNHNHLGTAFGGSLVTLATLAGYALLWLLLDDRTCHIVVKESRTRYLHPVTGALRAVCRAPAAADLESFQAALARGGKARLTLHATVEEGGRACVAFEGEFVALRPVAAA